MPWPGFFFIAVFFAATKFQQRVMWRTGLAAKNRLPGVDDLVDFADNVDLGLGEMAVCGAAD